MILIRLWPLFLIVATAAQAEVSHCIGTQLAKIDAKRIDAKQAVWVQRFNQQQFNANMAMLGAGTVTVGVLAGGAYLWHKYAYEPTIAQSTGLTEEQKRDFEVRYYQQCLEDRRNPRSAKEYFDWIVKNTNQAVLMTVCIALSGLIVKKGSAALSKMARKFDELTSGQGSQNFELMTGKLLDDLCRMHRSFRQLANYASGLVGVTNDVLHQQLCIQMVRNVKIDAVAFVNSFEECIAFVRALCLSTDSSCDQIILSTEMLHDLTNQVLDRLETSVQAIECFKPDAITHADSLSKVCYGLYAEFEYFVQMVGPILYEDDYAINRAVTL